MPLTEHKSSDGQDGYGYWVKLYLKGMLMGAAEVVPGVSGGTIAFITGIYERLLGAISSFSPRLLKLLQSKGISAAWSRLDGTFLVVLLVGMATSIFTVARVISHTLMTQPVIIWAFFFGLILASIYLVALEIKAWTIGVLATLLSGALIGAILTHVVPITAEPGYLFIFLGGAIAVCAWILPGLSGSFILLLLGLYAHVLNAINSLDLLFLGTLALGCIIGLVSFSHLLTWMFQHYRNETLGLLAGFMIGALAKVWPWKHTLSYQMGRNGEQIPLLEETVLPATYQEITGTDPQVAIAVGICLVGLVLVVVMERMTRD
jgi:putative membrane protein